MFSQPRPSFQWADAVDEEDIEVSADVSAQTHETLLKPSPGPFLVPVGWPNMHLFSGTFKLDS